MLELVQVLSFVAVALALQGCAVNLHRANVGGLVAAETLTACDAGQTLWAMHDGPPTLHTENNMLLGPRPSDEVIVEYMATAMIATAAVWVLLPERARPLELAPVAGVEVKAIAGNIGQNLPLCGL